MNKEQIIQAVETAVKERGCFLVEVTVSAENDIEIVIEKEEGIVDWEDCAAIDKVMHEAFDQDVEDYALTVSSAGLDRPFKVLRQYQKAIGTRVDVKFKGGKRLIATLTSADEESIGLQYTALKAVEGKKKKEKVEHDEKFPLAEINSVTPYIEFK
jgi:ribosome maturation factor RimP